MSAYQPNLAAVRVDRLLKDSLAELQRAQKNAALWFAEVLHRKLYRELGYSSMHQYAAVELKFSKTRTAQFIRLAESLVQLPGLRRSLAQGDVSWTKAREVARVATPSTEQAWIDHARRSTSRELEQKVSETKRAARALRTGASNQGRLPEADDRAVAGTAAGKAAGTAASVGRAGSPERTQGQARAAIPCGVPAPDPAALAVEVPVDLHLRLSPAQYARYEALMEKLRKLGGSGSREELLLAAMESAVQAVAEEQACCASRASGTPARTSRTSTDRTSGMAVSRTPAARASTAQLESTALPRGNSPGSHGTSSPRGNSPGSKGIPSSPYQVIVQVCERCEAASVETGRGSLTLAPSALKAILCDARIRGRGKRNRAAIPARVRRQVLERDRFRCRGAGCARTRFLAVHHLVPREAGGGNEPDNLITLCEGCHRTAHDAVNGGPRGRWNPAA
jgi:hypothetical protein